MLVNHGPSQQSSKEEYKPRKMRCYRKIPRFSYKGHRKEMQTAVVWSCFLFIRSGQNHLARHSERGKKTSHTEEEVGTQHQGMDRPGVRQVPEGNGEQGKMEKTGCEIICGVKHVRSQICIIFDRIVSEFESSEKIEIILF